MINFKKIITVALVATTALSMTIPMSVTSLAMNKNVINSNIVSLSSIDNYSKCEPANLDNMVLLNKSSKTYTENGFRIIETIEIYKPIIETYGTEKMRTVVSTKGVNFSGLGTVVTIRLDADFYYDNTNVRCPRYYSSYSDQSPELISVDETNFSSSTNSRDSLKIKTDYSVKVRHGQAGQTQTKTLSSWVSCDPNGTSMAG